MNEQTRNAIDMAYAADIAGMQSAIEDLVKTKVLDALEGKKQEVARELMNNTNEEKCCDELSPKQKKEMDVDDDEDIDEKDLKSLRKKKLKKEDITEEYEFKKTSSRKISSDESGLDDSHEEHSYDIHQNGKKVGEVSHETYYGSVKGKLHNKNLPDIGPYRGAKINDKLKSFLNSNTGKRWSKNIQIGENLEEKLSPSMGSEKYIHDFVHSDNPRFEGKSKKERIQMALGAYYSAKKGKTKNEEVSEGLELTKKKKMYKNPALPGTIAADRASGKFKKTLKKLNTPKGK